MWSTSPNANCGRSDGAGLTPPRGARTPALSAQIGTNSGNKTLKQLPSPTLLLSSTDPCRPLTTAFTIASPRPVPAHDVTQTNAQATDRRVRALSTLLL